MLNHALFQATLIEFSELRDMGRNIAINLVFILFFTIFQQPAIAAETLPVSVSIAPQKFFVQQIGRNMVDIQVMVAPGASPATYEPRPRQMAHLSKTKIYFAIGVPFEKAWLKKIAAANSKMKIVHTERGIERIPMVAHGHEDEHHDTDGDHTAKSTPQATNGLDPHIWLSPPLVKLQARSILSALIEIDPSHHSVYTENYDHFIKQIDSLHTRLTQTFSGKKGLRFLVFHPSWGYFARTYGLGQIPIEIEGKNPKPAQLQALIEHARKENIKTVFVQPQFSTKSAALVAKAIGGQVTFADPLAEDWLSNLRDVAATFSAALE